jgi:hypothetical protein
MRVITTLAALMMGCISTGNSQAVYGKSSNYNPSQYDGFTCDTADGKCVYGHDMLLVTVEQLTGRDTAASDFNDLSEHKKNAIRNVFGGLAGPFLTALGNQIDADQETFKGYATVVDLTELYTNTVNSACMTPSGSYVDASGTSSTCHNTANPMSTSLQCRLTDPSISSKMCPQGVVGFETGTPYLAYTETQATRLQTSDAVSKPHFLDFASYKSVFNTESTTTMGGTVELEGDTAKYQCPQNPNLAATTRDCDGDITCLVDANDRSQTGFRCSNYNDDGAGRLLVTGDAGTLPPALWGQFESSAPYSYDTAIFTTYDCDSQYFGGENILWNAYGTTYKCLLDPQGDPAVDQSIEIATGPLAGSVALQRVIWYSPVRTLNPGDSSSHFSVRASMIGHIRMILGDVQGTPGDPFVPSLPMDANSYSLGYSTNFAATGDPHHFAVTSINAATGNAMVNFAFVSRAFFNALTIPVQTGVTDHADTLVNGGTFQHMSSESFKITVEIDTTSGTDVIAASMATTATDFQAQVVDIYCHREDGGQRWVVFALGLTGVSETFTFSPFMIDIRKGTDYAQINGQVSPTPPSGIPGPPVSAVSATTTGNPDMSAFASIKARTAQDCTFKGTQTDCTDAIEQVVQSTEAGDISVKIYYNAKAMRTVELDCSGSVFCTVPDGTELVDRLRQCSDSDYGNTGSSTVTITQERELMVKTLATIMHTPESVLHDAPNDICTPANTATATFSDLHWCPAMIDEQCANPSKSTDPSDCRQSFLQTHLACADADFEDAHVSAHYSQGTSDDSLAQSAGGTPSVVTSPAGVLYLGAIAAPTLVPLLKLSVRSQLIFPASVVLKYTVNGGATVKIPLVGGYSAADGSWKLDATTWTDVLNMPAGTSNEVYNTVKNIIESDPDLIAARASDHVSDNPNLVSGGTATQVSITSAKRRANRNTKCPANAPQPHAFLQSDEASQFCADVHGTAITGIDNTCDESWNPQWFVAGVNGVVTHGHSGVCSAGPALNIEFNDQSVYLEDAGAGDADIYGGPCGGTAALASSASGNGYCHASDGSVKTYLIDSCAGTFPAGVSCSDLYTSTGQTCTTPAMGPCGTSNTVTCDEIALGGGVASQCDFTTNAPTDFEGCGNMPMDDARLPSYSDDAPAGTSFFDQFSDEIRGDGITMASAVGVMINTAYLAQGGETATTWELEVQYVHIGSIPDVMSTIRRSLGDVEVTTYITSTQYSVEGNDTEKVNATHRALQASSAPSNSTSGGVTVSTDVSVAPCAEAYIPSTGLFNGACVCSGVGQSRTCVALAAGGRPSDDDYGTYAAVAVETNSAGTFIVIAILLCGGVIIAQRMRQQEQIVSEINEKLMQQHKP